MPIFARLDDRVGLKPSGLASLFVQIAGLPDECHITGHRCGIVIVNLDRVYAGRLDVHVLATAVDPYDVGYSKTGSRGDGVRIRIQPDPYHVAAGNM